MQEETIQIVLNRALQSDKRAVMLEVLKQYEAGNYDTMLLTLIRERKPDDNNRGICVKA